MIDPFAASSVKLNVSAEPVKIESLYVNVDAAAVLEIDAAIEVD